MKKTLTTRLFVFFAILSAPLFAVAQVVGVPNDKYLKGYKEYITLIVNEFFVPVVIAISFASFLWGVYKYFIIPDGEREEGRQFIMYGIVGLVIIFSVWGLVNIVKDTIILDGTKNSPFPPTIKTKPTTSSI